MFLLEAEDEERLGATLEEETLKNIPSSYVSEEMKASGEAVCTGASGSTLTTDPSGLLIVYGV